MVLLLAERVCCNTNYDVVEGTVSQSDFEGTGESGFTSKTLRILMLHQVKADGTTPSVPLSGKDVLTFTSRPTVGPILIMLNSWLWLKEGTQNDTLYGND